MSNRYLVISADTHADLPTAQYRPYVDPQYREAFDDSLRMADELKELRAGLTDEEFARKWYEDNAEGLEGGWDATKRDKELAADGVVGEVIFPDADAVNGGAGTPFGAGLVGGMMGYDPELIWAGARAHNRWLAELCSITPERRAGIAVVPATLDPVRAVEEVRASREAGLRGGILIPAMWGEHEPYNHARYEPLWAVCAELDMPIHTHSGPSDFLSYGDDIGLMVSETRWWTARPLWFMLWSGVFERHPDLKFVVTECGAFWVADLLYLMDDAYLREHGSKKVSHRLEAKLSMKPSEYFDRNCFLGASNTRRRELVNRYEIGVGNIMWGNDFPHPEGTWPHTREFLAKNFFDIPQGETARIVGLNAAEVYNFDVEALRPLVDEIGPTPAELGQPESNDDARWATRRDAGRHWLTGTEVVTA